ncbi:hypothetical protein S7711_06519 [Stachybotrys chartarum IBT 7711]|uniref:NmrA-like domain-containing protein n=1 Tax=Stachybotrys chartarum (strain CBS 109288 / IBT 7711) TaxID=1280523 RepID=A0A084BBA4_STACB|nr:hypothetical protein S7711_06519 [Stachybotrys chartarum IBT 7711]
MPTYLITQATGLQARWTIQHLLDSGAMVHAVVRDPAKTFPVLQDARVTIFKGESTDFEAIHRAAQGCDGVFLNTFPIPGLEAQQAQTIVDASKKAGIKSVVATTSFITGNKSFWDDDTTKEVGLHGYYSSKFAVEEIVRGAGFDAYTILRPAFIHFDYLLPNVHGNYPELHTHGELVHVLNEGAKMPHTDASDIGKYAAAALLDPKKFAGQEIELSHENLTAEEARDIIATVSGREVGVKRLSAEEVKSGKRAVFLQAFHFWANVKDFSPVTAAAKDVQAKFGIPFTKLEAALQREKALLLECLPTQG